MTGRFAEGTEVSVNRIRHKLSRALLAIALLAGMVCLLARDGGSVHADGEIQVVENSYEVAFSEGITFRLGLKAEAAIKEVTLFYRRVGEGLTVRVPVSVETGESVFTHTWELEPGDVPVGARIEYYWHIMDEAGNELKTSPLDFEYEDDRFTWKALEEGSIILFWYGSNEAQARRLLDYATNSLARLQDEMGITLDSPVKIYVYQSKSDMNLALPRYSEAYDERILTLGVVVDDATLLLLGSHRDVEGTIAHELSHIVVGLATDNPYASLPRWLDEGLAMYAEENLPAQNRRALEDAIRRDRLISVRSLSGYTGDPSQVDLFYGEVYSLIEFMLQTYGKDKMAQLLDAIGEGFYQEDALQRVYGFGMDELDLRWRRSLGLQARGTPSPTAPITPGPARRRVVPCCGVFYGGLLGVAALVFGRRRARTA